ncbi:MAG TPA: TatD family hydrolase [Paludibacter sp.]|nr:TatD family hydrolase [Paludibacter sp.]
MNNGPLIIKQILMQLLIFVLQLYKMFVDIHTHTKSKTRQPSIRNLTLSEAEAFFSSNTEEIVSVGIHPWHADDFTEETICDIEKWLADKRLAAIGECGLDKNSKATIAKQLFIFNKQIELSERFQKPLIIHCVGCFNELFELKHSLKPQQLWIIHGFRGKPELAKQALKNGCALSFGEHFNPESVRVTPIEKLYIETDESDLQIEEVYAQIAITKDCTPTHLSAGSDFFQLIEAHK